MKSEKNEVQEQAKKPYATPKLTVHGNVEKITQNIAPYGDDGPYGSTIG